MILVVTIESDKSSVEIPSTISGKIESVNVKVGDKVSKGDLLLSIESSKESPQKKQFLKIQKALLNKQNQF